MIVHLPSEAMPAKVTKPFDPYDPHLDEWVKNDKIEDGGHFMVASAEYRAKRAAEEHVPFDPAEYQRRKNEAISTSKGQMAVDQHGPSINAAQYEHQVALNDAQASGKPAPLDPLHTKVDGPHVRDAGERREFRPKSRASQKEPKSDSSFFRDLGERIDAELDKLRFQIHRAMNAIMEHFENNWQWWLLGAIVILIVAIIYYYRKELAAFFTSMLKRKKKKTIEAPAQPPV